MKGNRRLRLLTVNTTVDRQVARLADRQSRSITRKKSRTDIVAVATFLIRLPRNYEIRSNARGFHRLNRNRRRSLDSGRDRVGRLIGVIERTAIGSKTLEENP